MRHVRSDHYARRSRAGDLLQATTSASAWWPPRHAGPGASPSDTAWVAGRAPRLTASARGTPDTDCRPPCGHLPTLGRRRSAWLARGGSCAAACRTFPGPSANASRAYADACWLDPHTAGRSTDSPERRRGTESGRPGMARRRPDRGWVRRGYRHQRQPTAPQQVRQRRPATPSPMVVSSRFMSHPPSTYAGISGHCTPDAKTPSEQLRAVAWNNGPADASQVFSPGDSPSPPMSPRTERFLLPFCFSGRRNGHRLLTPEQSVS